MARDARIFSPSVDPSVTSDASTHCIHNLFQHHRQYDRHTLALIRERNALHDGTS